MIYYYKITAVIKNTAGFLISGKCNPFKNYFKIFILKKFVAVIIILMPGLFIIHFFTFYKYFY